MGGGFGSKFGIGTEGMFACRLSKETKSPVKLMLTRYDEFVMAGNRPASWQKLKAGVKKDGTIVALKAQQYRLGGIGQGSQAGQPYIYRMGDTYREVYALHTNEDPRSQCAPPVIRRRRLRSNHSSTNSLTRSRWTRWSFARRICATRYITGSWIAAPKRSDGPEEILLLVEMLVH